MYTNKFGEFFGRVNNSGDIIVLHSSGEFATRLDANIYPVGSQLSAKYEHTNGIVISIEDAHKIGLDIE